MRSSYVSSALRLGIFVSKAADPELRLNLNADEAVNYGTVAKVMVLIEKAGTDRLSVVTETGG